MTDLGIKTFVMEDVRCFAERQKFEIKPLTFLVGENSTGKSTTLGCLQVLGNSLGNRKDIRTPYLDFNVDPYSMGNFKDIVSRKRPVGQNFKLGFEFNGSSIKEYIVTLTEKEQGAEPTVEHITIKFEDGVIHLRQAETKKTTNRQEQIAIDPNKTIISKNIFHVNFFNNPVYTSILSVADIFSILLYLKHSFGTRNQKPENEALDKFISDKNLTRFFRRFPKFFSFAPIRSRPKRTYDPLMEFESPEGSDTPMSLIQMNFFKSNKWKKLQEQLAKFGSASGLFKYIEIKKHSKSISDPFQIQVKVRGPRLNIMDVGYGVSQILPILVRIFSSISPLSFLLQQPEVHLHPKAQAELVSLFVNVIKERKHSFIIETHSDYMVNRARIEIKRNNISPEDVSLIYLEPKGSHVRVHNIEFDEESNLINSPGSYGDFFLQETDRLLWNSKS